MALSARHTPPLSVDQAESPLAMIVRVAEPGRVNDQGRHCAFFVTDVAEVMRPLPIERMANMPRFVLGLSIIRGQPTPIIDAATLLGQGADDARSDGRHSGDVSGAGDQDGGATATRFVVMRVGERRVALAVAAVLGVRPVARQSLRALPPLLRHAGDHAVAAIGALDNQLLTVLAGGYLVPPAFWDALPTQEPA